MNADKLLFRCHRLGDLMTEARSKAEPLSETTKSYLKMLYRELTWDRKKVIESKYLKKGLTTEEQSLTLLSLEKKIFLKKNEERLQNDFITGVPDTINTSEGYEIKSSWDWTTLPFKNEPIDKKYMFQVMGYMWLTGANKWTICYCLNNTPAAMIDDAKRRLSYQINSIDPDNDPVYIEGCKEIERNMIYDMAQFKKDYEWYDLATDLSEWKYDIPRKDRVVTYEVMRDESVIKAMQIRVLECRVWMNKNLFGV